MIPTLQIGGLGRVLLADGEGGGGEGPASYWDPARTSPSFVLSNSDKTATYPSGSDHEAVFGLTGRDAALSRYFEIAVNSGAANGSVGAGIGNVSAPTTTYPGGTANGCSYQSNGNVIGNASVLVAVAAFTAADVIGVLLKNGKLYFAKNGTWQNSADPDAETGAVLSGLSGTYYPAAGMFTTANQVTLRMLSSEFSYSMPSGASAWGA